MTTYRATFIQRGATLTPWHADTIFGSLCWAIVRREGEETLHTFLDLCVMGQPPVVISNGMPGALLPAPLIPRVRQPEATRAQAVASLAAAKARKSRTHLPLTAFLRACRGQDVGSELVPPPGTVRDALKNTVRRTGAGTVDDGGLYALAETWGSGADGSSTVVVYARVEDGFADLVGEALRGLARTGYGRRASAGYGQVDLAEWAPTNELDAEVPGANGFVTLSNFCPAAGDPSTGYYRTVVKYGRLGDERSTTEGLLPFKRPLIQVAAGACFYAERPAPFYGRMVGGVHPRLGDVMQYGFAFALPVALPALAQG